jgi:MFS family permease
MGIALFGLILLVALVIRDDAGDVAREEGKRWAPSGNTGKPVLNPSEGFAVSEAVRTSAFWLIVVGMTLQQFVRTGVVSQLVPHLEQVGFTRAAATGAMVLLAFFGMSSKLIFGRLSETITARLAFVAVMILQGIGLAVLIYSGGSIVTWAAIVVFGLGMGGVGALTPLLIFDMFGMRQFGSIMGLTSSAIIIPVFLGPIMAGLIFDSTGGYNWMFAITIGLLAVSVASLLMARVPTRPARRERGAEPHR